MFDPMAEHLYRVWPMSHSYHSRTTSQTKERSFERSANAKSVIKDAIYLSWADCPERRRTETDESPIKSNYLSPKTFFDPCASLHPSFLLNFLRDRVQFKGTETRGITWRGVRISRNKWRRNGAMIKPRDADEKGREWWRHAEEGGGSGK